jgi:diguanylate cyclase (GGDEF)-like protein
VGTSIARAGLRAQQVFVFAELAGMLCERGLGAAALRLEEQWTRLADHFTFSLTCACPSWAVDDRSRDKHLRTIGDRHVHALDAEQYSTPTPRQGELDLTFSDPQPAQRTRHPRLELAAVAVAPLRAAVDRRLERLIAVASERGVEAAIVYVNLDRFGQVIEMLGHSASLGLLEDAAARIGDCAYGEQALERLGYDEFAILLEGRSLADVATRLAKRIVEAFHAPLEAGRHRVVVTPSIGIEVSNAADTDADTLIRHARLAMRGAKQRGGNTFQNFEPTLEAEVRARFDIEQKLRLALENDEFVLHYQPVYNIGTGEIESIEALVRWQPPAASMISPGNFIPIAEETGLIVELGEWVLRAACTEAMRLHLQGFPDIHVAVNFSARQLREPRIAERVQRILQETGFDPACLVLELTESMLLDDSDIVRAALWSLKALGLRLALDDFGTGYSSLAYLKRMPVDCLKIDQSFVRDIGKDQESEAIVRTVLGIGRSMNLHVIAEGVETEAQLQFLVANGCHAVQGYLLGRPSAHDRLVPVLQMAASLARHISLARAQ